MQEKDSFHHYCLLIWPYFHYYDYENYFHYYYYYYNYNYYYYCTFSNVRYKLMMLFRQEIKTNTNICFDKQASAAEEVWRYKTEGMESSSECKAVQCEKKTGKKKETNLYVVLHQCVGIPTFSIYFPL